jgi:hypothetical protein
MLGIPIHSTIIARVLFQVNILQSGRDQNTTLLLVPASLSLTHKMIQPLSLSHFSRQQEQQ